MVWNDGVIQRLSGSKLGYSTAAVVCLQATGVAVANAEMGKKWEKWWWVGMSWWREESRGFSQWFRTPKV